MYLTCLKIDLDCPSCTSKWWVPLSWAISIINDGYNLHGIIGKDQKQIVVVLCNLRNDLHNLAEYRLKPLPAIFKQVRSINKCCFSLIFI